MFMAHMTPLENQARVHGYAAGGSPSAVPMPAAPGPTPPPIGSSHEEVADNIDAKLSQGEFVWPADVVKFYGMDWIQKQMTKAKEGMLKMAQAGMIKGDGPPVANTPEPDPNAEGPAPEKSIGAAAGGFFAPPGHPEHFANGGYQSYAAGGLALPSIGAGLMSMAHVAAIPGAHMSPISGKIPHNTGIVHSGIKGPIRNNTSLTHASIAAPHVNVATGGYMAPVNEFCGDGFSAGGMPGAIMTPYSNPTAPMTAQPDPYAGQQQQPRMQPGFMQPYS